MQLKWRWGEKGWCWLHGYRSRDGTLKTLSLEDCLSFIDHFQAVVRPSFVVVYKNGDEAEVDVIRVAMMRLDPTT